MGEESISKDRLYYIELCQRVGFELVESKTEGKNFYINMKKE